MKLYTVVSDFRLYWRNTYVAYLNKMLHDEPLPLYITDFEEVSEEECEGCDEERLEYDFDYARSFVQLHGRLILPDDSLKEICVNAASDTVRFDISDKAGGGYVWYKHSHRLLYAALNFRYTAKKGILSDKVTLQSAEGEPLGGFYDVANHIWRQLITNALNEFRDFAVIDDVLYFRCLAVGDSDFNLLPEAFYLDSLVKRLKNESLRICHPNNAYTYTSCKGATAE